MPVEINASTRAKDMLVRIGCGSDEEVEATGYGIVMPDEPASAQWQAGIQLEKREQA